MLIIVVVVEDDDEEEEEEEKDEAVEGSTFSRSEWITISIPLRLLLRPLHIKPPPSAFTIAFIQLLLLFAQLCRLLLRITMYDW